MTQVIAGTPEQLLDALRARPKPGLVRVSGGVEICPDDFMVIDGEPYGRQVTPDGLGGGFVSFKAKVPLHVPIPWNCRVDRYTRVFRKACIEVPDQGFTITGNVRHVSRVMTPVERRDADARAARRLAKMLSE